MTLVFDSPMKINFLIYRPQMHGGARVASLYARALMDAGHDVQVIGLGKLKYSLLTRLKRKLKNQPDPNANLDATYYSDQGIPYRQVDFKDRLTADDVPDADVTISTWWETAEWLEDFGAEKGVKVQFIQGHEGGMPYLDASRVEKVYRFDHRKIVVSQWLKDVLAEEYGVGDCVVIENAIDASTFETPKRSKHAYPTIGFIYSSAVQKNSALAIEACKRLRERNNALRVLAFGAADPYAECEFPEWIEFEQKPSRQRIAEIYASCDAWLFTSDREGFGLPILEAFASRTPVVATRAGAAPQLVNAATGALVDSTPEAVVEAVSTILSKDDEAWRALSDAAQAVARARNWDRAAKSFEKALIDFRNESVELAATTTS